jgi:tRNA pseudouridine55 synthase
MDGILLFNKPITWTSHDAVDLLRRKLGQRAVGHAGTLDPMATGLLVLLLGRATKRSQELSGLDKDYRGILTLGITTDTQDMEGRILRRASHELVAREDVENVFAGLRNSEWQIPPSYSAVRKEGKRLYDMARRGVAVTIEARPIRISELRLVSFRPPEIEFFASVSKGTYIRTLCDDAGKQLGCGACLSALVRTRIGSLHLSQALDAGDIRRLSLPELDARLLRGPLGATA